jgi:hypothetical protein
LERLSPGKAPNQPQAIIVAQFFRDIQIWKWDRRGIATGRIRQLSESKMTDGADTLSSSGNWSRTIRAEEKGPSGFGCVSNRNCVWSRSLNVTPDQSIMRSHLEPIIAGLDWRSDTPQHKQPH